MKISNKIQQNNSKEGSFQTTLYNTTQEKYKAINHEKELENFNKTFSQGFKQSPKITSGKARNILIQTPKYPFRNFNDKIFESRGTNFQEQFKRLSDEEINNLFGKTFTIGWNYDNNIMKKYRENTEKLKDKFRNCKLKKRIFNEKNEVNPQPEILKITKLNKQNNIESNSLETTNTLNNTNQLNNNNTNNIDDKNNINNNKDNNQQNNNNININQLKKNINNNQISNRSKSSYQEKRPSNLSLNIPILNPKSERKIDYLNTTPSHSLSHKNLLETPQLIEIKNRNDKWLPKGYNKYEYIVNNPKLLKKEITSKNKFAGKLPDLTLKDIKEKSRKSDIFFINPPSITENEFTLKSLHYPDHQNSDVFLEKNDLTSIYKDSEVYLFKPQKKETYTNSRESKSQWSAKPNIPTLLNHVSTEYNIINPGIKGISNTKNNILKDCENRKNPNVDCVNNFNPIYRQKSLSEFIDLTRNGAPNPGKDYLKSYNSSLDAFRIRNNVCNTFRELHKNYKDLITKPFSKEKFG